MYGLVNKALEDLVCTRFGADAWETIKQHAEVDVEVFLSMDAYPDDITYKLVGAASEILRLAPEEVLRTFGEYWVLYTAREGYGAMLQMAGDTLPVFLQNLNDLHTRVGLIFPSLQPPSFRCTDIQEDSLRLHHPCPHGQPPLQKQGRTIIAYNSAKQSRIQTRLSSGDARPALHAGSRSRMSPALVALTPMSTLLTTGDRA
jgi:hypothetical protein